MPPPAQSITLILAATPSLGIGKSGSLPWPQLKQEMAYFARVTKRVFDKDDLQPDPNPVGKMNAVLMGRKTWDSIPLRFRPLKGRVNVVITRDPQQFEKGLREGEGEEKRQNWNGREGPIVASSLTDAMTRLQSFRQPSQQQQQQQEIGRVFVIGGASIYRAALNLPQTKRILLTKIKHEFECDTFFPIDVERGEEEESWREMGKRDWERFVGEKAGAGMEEEEGIEYEFCLFEKVDSGAQPIEEG